MGDDDGACVCDDARASKIGPSVGDDVGIDVGASVGDAVGNDMALESELTSSPIQIASSELLSAPPLEFVLSETLSVLAVMSAQITGVETVPVLRRPYKLRRRSCCRHRRWNLYCRSRCRCWP